MTAPVLGVGPGGQFSGLVVRQGPELLGHTPVRRDKLPAAQRGLEAYMSHVADECLALLLDHVPWSDYLGGWDVTIAVEGVNPPTGKLGMIHVGGLIDTAMLAGYLYGRPYMAFHGRLRVAMVPPGRNGSGPLVAYPIGLRPTRGQGKGKDLLKHCRSAWDVAGTNLRLLAA